MQADEIKMKPKPTLAEKVAGLVAQRRAEREAKLIGLSVAKLQAEADIALLNRASDRENFDRLTAYIKSTGEQIDELSGRGTVTDKAVAGAVASLESAAA